MNALVFEHYGPPEVLHFDEVTIPVPQENEVLIKVFSVSLNASDVEFLTARPSYIRMFGPFRPKYRILGSDIAGVVEQVGRNVKSFQPGDAVLGDTLNHGLGGLAEYVSVPESALVHKPQDMGFEEAAALPQASTVALQGLRDKGLIRPGDKVLINGAGGGSGMFAIQMAKMFEAQVIGVDNTGKLEFMRSIGADQVLDYTCEDYTKTGERYDLILDFVARRPIHRIRRVLSPQGRYVLVGGRVRNLIQTVLLGPILSRKGGRQLGMLLHRQNATDLQHAMDLVESGKIDVKIDRVFPFNEAAEAIRYLRNGRAKGKLVVRIA